MPSPQRIQRPAAVAVISPVVGPEPVKLRLKFRVPPSLATILCVSGRGMIPPLAVPYNRPREPTRARLARGILGWHWLARGGGKHNTLPLRKIPLPLLFEHREFPDLLGARLHALNHTRTEQVSLHRVDGGARRKLARHLEKLPPLRIENYTTEINLRARDWMADVGRLLSRGYVLTIDYGTYQIN